MAAQRASDEVIDRSKIENRAPSVAALFVDRVAHSPNREAFRHVDAADPKKWSSVTWSEAGDRVRNLAAGLIVLGVQAEQRVALASATRYEWVLADLAVMCAGAATTTVYPHHHRSDVATSSPTPAAASFSPRTTRSSPNCARSAANSVPSRRSS